MAQPSAGFIPGTDRDPSQNADDVDSQGSPRQKCKLVYRETSSKQSFTEDMVAAKGKKLFALLNSTICEKFATKSRKITTQL